MRDPVASFIGVSVKCHRILDSGGKNNTAEVVAVALLQAFHK